jgi:hypothetical protein
VAAAGFAIGYAFTYVFELGGMKWWITRFLVPGAAMSLVCLALAGLEGMRRAAGTPGRLAWAALFVAAVLGPVTELAAVSWRNFVAVAGSDPFARRLEALATRRGPFLFESFEPNPRVARRDPLGVIVVGGAGLGQGLAMQTPAIPMARGRYRMGFRIDGAEAIAPEAPFVMLEIVGSNDRAVASRLLRGGELETRRDRRWATLDFELPSAAKDLRLRFWNLSDKPFKVVTMRLERR